MFKVIDGGEGDENDGGDTLNFNLSTTNAAQFNHASTTINNAINNGNADGEFPWDSFRIKWRNFETLVNNTVFTGVIAPADNGGGGDPEGPTLVTLYSDSYITVTMDADSGTVYVHGKKGGLNIPLASLSGRADVAAGQVMVSTVNEHLGVLLNIQALGGGQFSIQCYSTVDGALLTSAVITV